MILTLSVPSKTFLAGEYAVLRQGPALILNTSPRFELVVRRGDFKVQGIPEGSPAWRWIGARRPLLENFTVEFRDPHEGKGGLGASGAQFLMVHTLTTFLQSSFSKVLVGAPIVDVWKDHHALSEGLGSGADLLAQNAGWVSRVDMSELRAEALDWPYPELSWSVVRTHQKVPTHDHLKTLDRMAPAVLAIPAAKCVSAFGQATSEVFVGHLKAFAQTLRDLGLHVPSTMTLIQLLERESWCLMAKGCGALGADTVLVLYPTEEREKVNQFMRKQSLFVVATVADLTGGLEMKGEWA